MEKILHWLEMKIMRTTAYSNQPLTIQRFGAHLWRHVLAPFKKRGWFGYCDECGKFRRDLESQVIDVDYVDDGEGPVALAIRGMVCQGCYAEIESHDF